ncbi:MAG: tetraacyldisaccharide 4'-kinase [Candidatus Neomarinimicrobiota bacterium]|nr:tetraacyldisaccharide 4'-kinase [Candidatus Neomarinimicrobiota bacterium]
MSGWSRITEKKVKFLLFPITLFYWGVIYWRNLFYNLNFFVSRKIPTKVISVGNITAGGTGKTPAVIYLSQLFQRKNYKVAVLSRGYGRKTAGTQLVTDGNNKVNDWRNFGDEPTLISQKLNKIPIVVDQNRYRGAMYLIEKFSPDLIIMDDAFQHRSIERDLDLVLLNSQAGQSDYRLIPHGLLREPFSHIKRADAIIFTKSNLNEPSQKIVSRAKKTNLPIFNSSITHNKFLNINSEAFKPENKPRAVAVSGIADPKSFYKSLDKTNIKLVSKIAYVDHHEFKQSDIDRLKKALIDNSAEIIVTTEKDMIRLANLDLGEINIYSLSIDFQLDEPGEKYITNLFK